MANLQKIINSVRLGYKQLVPAFSVISKRHAPLRAFSSAVKTSSDAETVNLNSKNQLSSVENEDHKYEEDIKVKILSKALEYVNENGWSTESLVLGAEAVGYPGVTHGLFPNGGGDLVHHFNLECNATLVDLMKKWPNKSTDDSVVPAKFVEDAIVTRLKMIQPYKNTWPKAMAIQALPSNVPNSLAALLSLVDDICFHSGDRSVNINWYIRRVGLAGIYKTGELFFLTDKSEDCAGTRNFVAARIREAQIIQGALNLNPVSTAPQALTAAFVTAKNILGLNSIPK